MSKLLKMYAFVDLSDYGRPVARWIAQRLKNTSFTPIHVTFAFAIAGILAIICILEAHYRTAGCFLILKSILDAADGELSRLKNTPSYVGRYLDSIFDILLNLAFLLTIWYVTDASLLLALLAFGCMQLQGTLYNYYYVILRHKLAKSDTTSRVFEDTAPQAFAGEDQRHVNLFFAIFHFLYGLFDKIIYLLDRHAIQVQALPNWFMTMVSVYGLGFQLMIIATMLAFHFIAYIIPFFIAYSMLMVVFIAIRRKPSFHTTRLSDK